MKKTNHAKMAQPNLTAITTSTLVTGEPKSNGAGSGPGLFAYADPPYINQAFRHYRDDPRCAEVDHEALIRELDKKYDGWALSCSSTSLQIILGLCPPGVRIGAWVKPFSSYKKANPAYTWEPVIFKPCRSRKGRFVVRDFVAANITLKRGLCGVKPDRFCYWLFEILGMQPEDEFCDLYPGSGAVTRAWIAWKARELQRRITGEPFGLYVQKKDLAPIAQ